MNSGAHIHAYPKPHYMAKSHWTMYSNRSLFMEITVGINIIVTIVTEITDTEGHKDVFFYNNEAKRKTCYWWVNNYKEFWKDWRKMGLRFGGGQPKNPQEHACWSISGSGNVSLLRQQRHEVEENPVAIIRAIIWKNPFRAPGHPGFYPSTACHK